MQPLFLFIYQHFFVDCADNVCYNGDDVQKKEKESVRLTWQTKSEV